MKAHEDPFQSTLGNPFLEPIEKHLNTNDLEKRLSNWPLAGLDVAHLSMQSRFDLLDRMQEQMFEPTLTAIDTTTRLFRMIRRGYIGRDPTQIPNRVQGMALARFAGKDLRDLPWFPMSAKGMRISGVTGLGKTYEVLRALKLLPQVIRHGHSQAADWTHLTQVTWLYVAMSHDGSLGGLLLQILVALDRETGTDYSRDRSLTNLSNEKLAVHVGIILHNHGVGVLVIDEIQGRNFSGGARGGLAATFFLRLLNFGIPLVLMGNPLGMDALDRFSQDMRRTGSGGSIEMHPMDVDDYDFTNVLAPAMWRYNVMPKRASIDDKDGKILFHYCGGIRDYAARICVSAQRLALDLGEQFITEAHLKEAFSGPDFSTKERSLIAGFRDKNPLLLQQFDDVPWQQYAVRWGLFTMPDNSAETAASGDQIREGGDQASVKPRKPVAQQAKETAQRNRTRKTNQATKRATERAGLHPEDMRNEGLQEYLISGLEQLKQGGDQSF
jgi:hypothetical protein